MGSRAVDWTRIVLLAGRALVGDLQILGGEADGV